MKRLKLVYVLYGYYYYNASNISSNTDFRPLEVYLICSVPVAWSGVRERAFPLATYPATGGYGLTACVRALIGRLALSYETLSARFS